LLGRLGDGLGYYRFVYNGGHTAYVGVMAQEVEAVMPKAVMRRLGWLPARLLQCARRAVRNLRPMARDRRAFAEGQSSRALRPLRGLNAGGSGEVSSPEPPPIISVNPSGAFADESRAVSSDVAALALIPG
jgi:hypothetical protein